MKTAKYILLIFIALISALESGPLPEDLFPISKDQDDDGVPDDEDKCPKEKGNALYGGCQEIRVLPSPPVTEKRPQATSRISEPNSRPETDSTGRVILFAFWNTESEVKANKPIQIIVEGNHVGYLHERYKDAPPTCKWYENTKVIVRQLQAGWYSFFATDNANRWEGSFEIVPQRCTVIQVNLPQFELKSRTPPQGSVTIFASLEWGTSRIIDIQIDGNHVGSLNINYFPGSPSCGVNVKRMAITEQLPAGTHSFLANDDGTRTWKGSFEIKPQECTLIEISLSQYVFNKPPTKKSRHLMEKGGQTKMSLNLEALNYIYKISKKSFSPLFDQHYNHASGGTWGSPNNYRSMAYFNSCILNYSFLHLQLELGQYGSGVTSNQNNGFYPINTSNGTYYLISDTNVDSATTTFQIRSTSLALGVTYEIENQIRIKLRYALGHQWEDLLFKDLWSANQRTIDVVYDNDFWFQQLRLELLLTKKYWLYIDYRFGKGRITGWDTFKFGLSRSFNLISNNSGPDRQNDI